MVLFIFAAVTGTLDTAVHTDLEHLTTLGIWTIEQSRQDTNSLVADHIGGLLHGIGLGEDTESAEELIAIMLKHQTRCTVVVESSITLRLLHCLLER